MSTELIERLAREAGMQVEHAMRVDLTSGAQSVVGQATLMRAPTDQLARFAALLADRCARIADSEYLTRPPGKHIRAVFPMPPGLNAKAMTVSRVDLSSVTVGPAFPRPKE